MSNASIHADEAVIIDAATQHYLTSGDFNGTPVRLIDASDDTKRHLLKKLVEGGHLSLNFGDRHPNSYIQAFEPESIEEQVAKVAIADLTHVCCYPTKSHLANVVNSHDYADRPYTLALAAGEPQLTCRFFELRVLEHYRSDPRYSYQTDDIQGSISIRDKFYQSEQTEERDKVLLQQFGFGYDREVTNRVVAVLLRDLEGLSPEHQRVWHANELLGDYLPHPDFWGSVCGHWPERVSIFQAFVEELQQINDMAKLMNRPPLFREDFRSGSKPNEFGFLIRPTLSELNDFILLLDKLMSDNIDVAFFKGEVDIEVLEPRRDGAVVARQKGTIAVLKEWLQSKVRFSDPKPKDEMIAMFKQVRKLRQKPAHAINENEFDQKYFREQRELIIDAYGAVRTLRLIFANDPRTKSHTVPDWLYKGEIWTR